MKAFSNTLIIIPSPECSASINLGVLSPGALGFNCGMADLPVGQWVFPM